MGSNPEREELINKTIALDANKIQQMITQCQLLIEKTSSLPNPRLTSNTIVTALLWLCWIRAKHQGSDAGEKPTNAESSIIVVADVRDRAEPRLPYTYMGNALLPVETLTRIQEVLRIDEC